MRGKQKILVAMSGGVDSSVAAAVLLNQGYEVVGVTMKLWGGTSDTGCCSVSDVIDARRVADQLGIQHHVFNFGDEFDTHVVDHTLTLTKKVKHRIHALNAIDTLNLTSFFAEPLL